MKKINKGRTKTGRKEGKKICLSQNKICTLETEVFQKNVLNIVNKRAKSVIQPSLQFFIMLGFDEK